MVVETISLIVKSCKRRSKLIDSTERLLRDKLSKKSSVTVDLGNNWYFLNESIKSALLEKGISSKGIAIQNRPDLLPDEIASFTSRPPLRRRNADRQVIY